MALYTVTAECVAGGKHYTRPHATPVEVGAAEAKPLLAAGCLEAVAPEPAADKPEPRHPKDSADS